MQVKSISIGGPSSAADPHRQQVNVLEVPSDQEIHGVKNDKAVELPHVLVRVTGLAVNCVREYCASVAEVAAADPCLERELTRRKVLQVTDDFHSVRKC